ncbi:MULTISPECIES: hypothetical protein [Cupriavidus]|jgi:hypothetical protein|uniref:hypothetical protein n=1 Tax=Cupriavidus TaxID=106589 RepID=UPI000579225E|nr:MULTISPECIES: hypothetical protein [Cupriavidus]KWR80329.1 hypothetical protein RN01_19025 [Cupriavidus sp. SHE]QWC87726.1 hypothetical protein KB891_11800 [Cupriavidus metallidurans]
MRKRSHYQQRPIAIPMTTQNRQHVELTYYADLASFISAPTDTAYNRLMRTLELASFAMAAQDIADYTVQLRSAKRAMSAVFDRSQITGRVTVLELEAMTLRAAAPAIEEAVCRVRLDTFNAAHAINKELMRAQGAPVEA